ncbi:MAG TPA: SH3 domain-containing protein [Candidatus Limnocylindrales bacterium]|jgi:hypothetical protein|nr:SH3 domain-containing protein [Candidatus Limnocylindrales bacterium]
MNVRRALVGLLAALLLAGLGIAAAQTAEPVTGCLNLQPTRLIVHERGRVSGTDPTPINVRAEPGTNAGQIGQFEAGVVFYVLEGPACTVSYTWYRVKARGTDAALEGWIAEGDARAYFVERYPPGL